MKFSLDWVSLIVLAGSAIGIFLALILFGLKKGNKLTDFFLGAFLFFYSLSNLGSVPTHSGFITQVPHIFGLFMPFIFLIGPFLFLYILSLTRLNFGFVKTNVLHFVPYAVVLVLFFAFVYIRDADFKINLIRRMQAGEDLIGIEIYAIARIVHILVYLALCLNLLRKHAKTLTDNFSALERIDLNWLRLLVLAYATGIVAVVILAQLDVPDTALHFYGTLVILIIGARGLTQTQIFGRESVPEEAPKSGPKYERSSLTMEQAAEAERLLLAVMENDKLYLEEELSLRSLSEKIGFAPSYVSQVINERLKKNFYDFVNGFRVEEAQRILRDPRRRDQKILGIAFDTGFASKVAFNRVFKKYTGLTPSEYKNQFQGNKSSIVT
jgi:AraC-like DNA-binding protein